MKRSAAVLVLLGVGLNAHAEFANLTLKLTWPEGDSYSAFIQAGDPVVVEMSFSSTQDGWYNDYGSYYDNPLYESYVETLTGATFVLSSSAGGQYLIDAGVPQGFSSGTTFNATRQAALSFSSPGDYSISAYVNASFSASYSTQYLVHSGYCDDYGCYGFEYVDGYANNYSFGDYIYAPQDLFVHVTAVPEPETWAMNICGLGVLGWLARRRGRR